MVRIVVLYYAGTDRWSTSKMIAEDAGQLIWALTKSSNRPAEVAGTGGLVQVKAVTDGPEETQPDVFVLPIDAEFIYWRIWS